jgi:Icc-related predicted phosphoesterase
VTLIFFVSLVGVFKGDANTYSFESFDSGHIHKVKLTGLKPGTVYYYVCGDLSNGPFSDERSFKSAPDSSSMSKIKFVAWGDPGQTENSLFAGLEALKQNPDMIFIPGDISYADEDESRWDSWGRMFEFVTARFPTMVIPGNHENYGSDKHEFIAYQNRFFMPSDQSKAKEGNLYWSTNFGPMHFVSLNTESNYNLSTDMYDWFVSDLKSVDRTVTPWLVLSFHRPFYNTNKAHYGQMQDFQAIYEPLIHRFCVDFVITGHVHAYERTGTVFNGEIDKAGTTQYFTLGNGGNFKMLDSEWIANPPQWSAFRAARYGFATFEIFNSTHALHTFFETDQDSRMVSSAQIADQTWISRSFPRSCQ